MSRKQIHTSAPSEEDEHAVFDDLEGGESEEEEETAWEPSASFPSKWLGGFFGAVLLLVLQVGCFWGELVGYWAVLTRGLGESAGVQYMIMSAVMVGLALLCGLIAALPDGSAGEALGNGVALCALFMVALSVTRSLLPQRLQTLPVGLRMAELGINPGFSGMSLEMKQKTRMWRQEKLALEDSAEKQEEALRQLHVRLDALQEKMVAAVRDAEAQGKRDKALVEEALARLRDQIPVSMKETELRVTKEKDEEYQDILARKFHAYKIELAKKESELVEVKRALEEAEKTVDTLRYKLSIVTNTTLPE